MKDEKRDKERVSIDKIDSLSTRKDTMLDEIEIRVEFFFTMIVW